MKDLRKLEITKRQGMPATGMIGTILVIVVATILLSIGFVVTAKTQNQIPTDDLTTDQNATLNALSEDAGDNFEFAGLAIFILVVVAIISGIAGLMYLFGR